MGICSAKNKNLVNLTNLAWRLLANAQYPWARIIHELHGNMINIKTGSFIWNIIIQGWEICRKGITWIPHRSSSLNVWDNCWIHQTPTLRECIQGALGQRKNLLIINDLWLNNQWDLSKTFFEIHSPLANKIKATTPNNLNHDIPTWSHTSNGLFSSTSCHNLLNSHPNTNQDFNWIWNKKCPNKMKFLLWKYLHNKLPTRVYLNHIGINIDPICSLCKQDRENISHIFIHCIAVKDFWAQLGINMSGCNPTNHWLINLRDLNYLIGRNHVD